MYRAGRFTCVKNISQKTKRNLTRKSFWIWMFTLQDPSVYTQWERDGWKFVPVLEGCFEASNCLCPHNNVFKVVPINNGCRKKWVFIKNTFPLDWLITLCDHSGWFYHNVCGYTVFKSFWFNVSFTTSWGWKVMTWHCWHQHLDHFIEVC